jgi:hypothetical protein
MDAKYMVALVFMIVIVLSIASIVMMPSRIVTDVGLFIMIVSAFSLAVIFSKKKYIPR